MTRSHEASVQSDPDAIHAANIRFVLGNAATNGRLFVAGMVAIDLALFGVTGAIVYVSWALMALAGVGAAFAVDRMPDWMDMTRRVSSILAVLLPAGSFALTLLKLSVL